MAKPFPGGRELIREAFRFQEVPSAALDIILASLSSATIQQYTRPLRNWWIFCQDHKICPFSPEIDYVIAFLTQELRNVSSYSTLNTMRSAISLISDSGIGKHPLVKRFCKEASINKQQKSRYDFTWDPALLLRN